MAKRPKFDVFLSHNSVDKTWASQLKDELQQRGISVWIDRDQIRPGDLFAEALEDGLNSSKAVALIVSPEAMQSGWVREEYYRALNLAQPADSGLRLIPVLLRDAELPGFLGARQWVDFRDEGRFSQSIDELVWGITGNKAEETTALSARQPEPVRVPHFECGGVVEEEDFIDREEELETAEQIIREGRRFMVVGEPRVGKTCFCEQLIRRISSRAGNEILATRIDLESIGDLTIDTFLGHTVIYMLGTAADVFGCKYAHLRTRDMMRLPPAVREDPAFLELRHVAAAISEHIFYRDNVRPSPLELSEFVQYTRDILSIIRGKGWRRYVMFYDEANKMTPELSVQVLARNAQVLAASYMTSIFVASPEMARCLRGQEEAFGPELSLGPFRSRTDMKRLLARYYHRDASLIHDLPITSEALERVWALSGGSPFYLQHILRHSFEQANAAGSHLVTKVHVKDAIGRLAREKPKYFAGFEWDD